MKRLAALILTTVTAVALAGCGSSAIPGTTASTSSVGASSPQSTTKPIVQSVSIDAKAAALLPADKKKIVVGSNLQSPPATYLEPDGKTPIGFEIDLISAAAKKIGAELDIQNMQFDTLISSLQSKRVDLTIASMNDNTKRQQTIDFVDYFNSGIAILVKKGNPEGIKGPRDLCGKDTSAAPGSSQLAWAEKESPTLCTGKPINVVTNDNDQQRLNDLKTGRVQSTLNDLPNLTYIAQTSGGGNDFEVVNTPLIAGAPYGIGFNKQSTQLRDAIQAGIQSLIDDGTYGKILDAWGLKSGALQKATVNAGK